jgi:hypothetical protein
MLSPLFYSSNLGCRDENASSSSDQIKLQLPDLLRRSLCTSAALACSRDAREGNVVAGAGFALRHLYPAKSKRLVQGIAAKACL